MFGTNWKQKYEAELAAHLETAVFNDVKIAGLTEHQHKLVAQQTNDRSLHQSDRRRWEEVLAMKEAAWDKERARLEGRADAFREKAELYDLMTIPFGQPGHGGTFIHNGKRYQLIDYRTGDPAIILKHAYPDGRSPV